MIPGKRGGGVAAIAFSPRSHVMGGKTMKYAVVGFGTAGYHAVKKIRELDKEGCIDLNMERYLALWENPAVGKAP